MRKAWIASGLGLALAALAASAAPNAYAQPEQPPRRVLTAIPAPFFGEWSVDLRTCGPRNVDPLRITAREMNFFESGGKVMGVFSHGALELVVVADMSGEGNEWLGAYRFNLSPDGRRLTMSFDGMKTVRQRCPRRPVRARHDGRRARHRRPTRPDRPSGGRLVPRDLAPGRRARRR